MARKRMVKFDAENPANDLAKISDEEVDDRTFGTIKVDKFGRILRYIMVEGDTRGRDPEEMVGKNFPFWCLTDDGERLIRSEPDGHQSPPIVAPDRLVRQSENFVLAGRRDQAIQVGGVNVSLNQVAETIRSHPDVVECEVRSMRSEEGRRLKAFVVACEKDQNISDLRRKLDYWLRERLSAPERPKSLTLDEALPRDEQGEISNWP